MKRFSKILGVVLSVVIAFSAILTVSACSSCDDVEQIEITFKVGETSTKKKIEKGTALSRPADPTGAAGQTFRHWYIDAPSVPHLFSKKLSANTTITAYFTTAENEVKVDYYTSYTAGQFNDLCLSVYVNRDEFVADPEDYQPTDEITTFKYWKEASGARVSFPFMATNDLEVYAHMDTNLTVKFATLGGDPVESVFIEAGGKISAPAAEPRRSGYKFICWTTESGAVFDFANTAIVKSITLYAKWESTVAPIADKTLVMSLGEIDGILHPFFSSSSNDSQVHGQTQVSLLTSDGGGNIDMGHHVPTVAQDYSQTTYVQPLSGGAPIKNPKQSDINALGASKNDSNHYWTEYKFLIKNGIKFDDNSNEDLTINDVIFNMYVYLDPSYTGSSTLYSTPIAGLAQYQQQNSLATEGGNKNTYLLAARKRRMDITEYFHSDSITRGLTRNATTAEQRSQILADTQWLRREFYNELVSDWSAYEGLALEKVEGEDVYYKTGFKVEKFKTTAEVFARSYGLIILNYKNSTTLDDAKCDYSAYNAVINSLKAVKSNYTDADLKAAFINTVFTNTLGVYSTAELAAQRTASGYLGYPSLDLTFNSEGDVTGSTFITGTPSNYDYTQLYTRFDKESDNAVLINIESVALGSASGQKAITEWTAEEQSKAFTNIAGDNKLIKTVSGITVENTKYENDGTTLKAANTFSGQMGVEDGQPLHTYAAEDEGQYVLCIKITGIDPKAIWNFGITITPMSYYSNTSGKTPANIDPTTWAKISGKDYTKFNYPGCPGYDAAKPVSPGFYTHEVAYFNGVFKDSTIMRVPRGAGPFKASNSTNSETIPTSGSAFVRNNVVYYVANTNFKTTGKEMTNVQFKNLRYQILEGTKVLNNLKLTNSGLHYGDVNAKEDNLRTANNTPHLTGLKIDNNGYGYVGINARYVPNINVRKAIMTAMNTDLVQTYYGSMAEIIHRPISTNSWAYPKNATDAYPYVSESAAKSKIAGLLAGQGYNKGGDGVLTRTNPKTGLPDKLEYTFTIAGSEKDHPAYVMFTTAANILNEIGFKITVYPDSQALLKLASGTLAVWAAAWSSTIDPDMYQTYHKDSQAQSVNNWGYPYLIDENNGTTDELNIIDSISTEIVNGRSTLIQNDRKSAYERALKYVMDLAVEYPTYQRYNLVVFNKNVIDANTINKNITAYSGPLDTIWKVKLK